MAFDWTPAAEHQLRTLWRARRGGQPEYSTAEIGRLIGCGKNAAIGKAHRIGLPARPAPVVERRPDPKAAAIKPAPVVVSAAAEAAPCPGKRASAVETARRAARSHGLTCQWVVGEPAPGCLVFCSDLRVPGQSYCTRHAERDRALRARRRAQQGREASHG